jgi:dipeptidase
MKPSWIWGAEMGANEFGLNIGNEAVFTREKYGPEALIGMDMLRLALERCRSSDEGLELLIELLHRYGQGGNCGYQKKFYYHNSFLIADPQSAWVLETAGSFWAAEKVHNVRSISNRLSIGNSFDRAHPDLVRHAVEKKWCKNEDDFHFARCYSEPVFSYFSGSEQRGRKSLCILENEKGKINLQTMKRILRSHEEGIEGMQFARHSLKSVCMHGGFIFGDHTTGSYIAEIGKKISTCLATGSSTPCLALFKPICLPGENSFVFDEADKERALDFWMKRELFHRAVLENRVPDLGDYLKERDHIENDLEQRINSIDPEIANPEELYEISAAGLKAEEELLQKYIVKKDVAGLASRIKGNPYFRYYWRSQTRNLIKQK